MRASSRTRRSRTRPRRDDDPPPLWYVDPNQTRTIRLLALTSESRYRARSVPSAKSNPIRTCRTRRRQTTACAQISDLHSRSPTERAPHRHGGERSGRLQTEVSSDRTDCPNRAHGAGTSPATERQRDRAADRYRDRAVVNHHCAHTSLGGHAPITRVNNVDGRNNDRVILERCGGGMAERQLRALRKAVA
jgi:hypothetical protein